MTARNGWSTNAVAAVLDDVKAERVRQHERWGDQSRHPNPTWLAILTEEVGEAAQAVLHDEFGGHAAGTLRAELVQVAAVAAAWIEVLDRRAAVCCAVCGEAVEGVQAVGTYHVHARCT